VGLAVDAGATSEAAAACGTAVGLLDELFPAVLAALRHDDDAAAMTVVPFLQVSILTCSEHARRLQCSRSGTDGNLMNTKKMPPDCMSGWDGPLRQNCKPRFCASQLCCACLKCLARR